MVYKSTDAVYLMPSIEDALKQAQEKLQQLRLELQEFEEKTQEKRKETGIAQKVVDGLKETILAIKEGRFSTQSPPQRSFKLDEENVEQGEGEVDGVEDEDEDDLDEEDEDEATPQEDAAEGFSSSVDFSDIPPIWEGSTVRAYIYCAVQDGEERTIAEIIKWIHEHQSEGNVIESRNIKYQLTKMETRGALIEDKEGVYKLNSDIRTEKGAKKYRLDRDRRLRKQAKEESLDVIRGTKETGIKPKELYPILRRKSVLLLRAKDKQFHQQLVNLLAERAITRYEGVYRAIEFSGDLLGGDSPKVDFRPDIPREGCFKHLIWTMAKDVCGVNKKKTYKLEQIMYDLNQDHPGKYKRVQVTNALFKLVKEGHLEKVEDSDVVEYWFINHH